MIRHRDSGREYVGSSINLYARFMKHKSDLNKGQHHSPILQNAWNKHGEASFDLVVVETVDSPETLLAVEQAWIDRLDPFYNCCKIAGNRLGFKASDETKRKQSAALRGKKRTPEQVENIRLSQLGKTLSAEHRAKCGRKGQRKPDGFGEKIRIANLGRKMRDADIEKMAETKRKEYLFTSPEGEGIVARGLRRFCKEHGLNPSSMSAIARGKRGSLRHRGWTCRYIASRH